MRENINDLKISGLIFLFSVNNRKTELRLFDFDIANINDFF
jgi:hypothetical protein